MSDPETCLTTFVVSWQPAPSNPSPSRRSSFPIPGPGEALVQVQACGVCHTDLHYREGGISDDFPYPARPRGRRHRRSGRSRRHERRARRLRRPQLARGVRRVPRVPARPAVVLLRHAQRRAEDDARATARRCRPRSASARSRRRRSSPPGRRRRSNPAASPKAAGLLGCGVMAGFGAATYTGGVGRGDTVAVFGCGGVGDAAIAAARLAGARTIIAVDLDPRKLEWAKDFGATHTVDASKEDPVEADPGAHRRQRRRRVHRGRRPARGAEAGVLRA